MRRSIVLCIAVLLVGIPLTQVSASDVQISQGFTYWNASARFDWSWITYEAEAPWYGLQIKLVTPDVWWAECLLATGEKDYANAVDVVYAREAQFLAGLYSSRLGLGVGGIWMSEDLRGSLPPYSTLGALATVRAQFLLVSDSLTASAAITVLPMVFGENPVPREFIELYAGINHETSWLTVNAGYRHRYFYNYDTNLRISGLVVTFLLRLGKDDV